MTALACAFASVCGCGGAASEADRHALYAALQVEEARVAAAEHTAVEGACADRPAARDTACDASRAAHVLSTRIGEADALTRAERARRTCDRLRTQPACESAGEPGIDVASTDDVARP